MNTLPIVPNYTFALCRLLLLAALLLANTLAYAQNEGKEDKKVVKCDTFLLKKYCKLVYPDTTIILKRDTVIYVYEGDTIKIRQRRIIRVFNELFRIDPNAGKDSLEFIQASKYFKKYKGKRIGEITIKRVEIFGTSIYDTSMTPENWPARAGNAIHVDTREKEIRHNLLIKKGEKLSPPKLADNERILRQLPYINDARVVIVPRKGGGDTVDILIITRDQWSIEPDLGFSGISGPEIGIIENNFLGLGHQFSNIFYLRFDSLPFGYEGIYRVQNLFGSFLTGKIQYTNVYQKTLYEVSAVREFLSADIKNAGGFGFRREQLDRPIYLGLEDSVIVQSHFFVEDAWYGRSFEYKPHRDDEFRSRSSIIVAGRILNKHYTRRPDISVDSNAQYQNTTLFVSSLSFSQRDYYKSNFIFGFGRTEDVPKGRLFQFTLGFQRGELYHRAYIGAAIARGGYIDKIGYFNGNASFGTFFHNGGVEEGVLSLRGLYFTELYKLRKFNFRWIARANYTYGINQPRENYIELRGINGLRDADNVVALKGKQRLALSVENSIFTPWVALGFRFGMFYFADIGYITQSARFMQKGNGYYGFGAGVRIKSENFSFPILQLSIAVYPAPPAGQFFMGFYINGQSELEANDFNVTAPGPVDFR